MILGCVFGTIYLRNMSEISKKVVTRFAPSPTGEPHIGNVRTAFYAWLFARKHNGEFLVRIEDTDRTRLVEGSAERILEMWEWLGLDYDGEVIYQSTRKDIHQKYAEQLVEEGKAYKCFCTSEELDAMRKAQQERKEQPRYDSRCRHLSEEEILKQVQNDKPYVIRLATPETGETVVQDIIRGEVTFDNAGIDDLVILKADGFPTYHLAHIVDDHDSNVTHVIRAEEWLNSLPKHYLIHQALGWDVPTYAHLPIVLATDKSKLSKRHGAVSMLEFRDLGYLPPALINFMLLLGWHPKEGSEQEVFTIEEMKEQFDLADVTKSGAVFDYQKLDWMNAEYIKKLSTKELLAVAEPFIEGFENIEGIDLEAAVTMEQERIKRLAELTESLMFLFKDIEYEAELLVWKKSDAQGALEHLKIVHELIEGVDDWSIESIEAIIKERIEKDNLGMGDTLWPMRTALTGEKNSPGPFEVAYVLGKEKCLYRINKAIEQLTTNN